MCRFRDFGRGSIVFLATSQCTQTEDIDRIGGASEGSDTREWLQAARGDRALPMHRPSSSLRSLLGDRALARARFSCHHPRRPAFYKAAWPHGAVVRRRGLTLPLTAAAAAEAQPALRPPTGSSSTRSSSIVLAPGLSCLPLSPSLPPSLSLRA
ncbi:hypothetical protein HPB50_018660 [Hyalomma asiaticum]|uniref:Uncharacterized protein n=1 Tax=Hyalomma asiaticum TaxID=266040 RepID=A0ACB7SMK3_HYAAI|nr:hypothetical protein HPB50_018660 [Hyalomma asiaticum]